MPKAPVELTLYDEENEPVKKLSRVIVPWGILKKAVRMAKWLNKGEDEITEAALDELSDLVVQIFGEQNVTRKELDDYADIGDMIATIQAIVARGQGLIPNAPPAGK